MKDKDKRLLIILYAGDYREAYHNITSGQGETYYAHKYAIDSIKEIGKQIDEAAVLCCRSEEPYNELLEEGFRVIGTGFNPDKRIRDLIHIIERYKPTHLVIRTPIRGIFRWAIRNKVRTITLLADSFINKGFIKTVKNYLLARLLNQTCVEWVGNHGVNSCHSLQQIGVNSNKIIPWDWPHTKTPADYSPKMLRANASDWILIYVGSVIESKGVGDILKAVARLRDNHVPVNLKVVGKGQIQYFAEQAKHLGIEDAVQFLGLLPNKTIVQQMIEADLVLVPSRHEYPEGLPLTIYEALCSRTPIVASDHPMFQGNLEHGVSAMIFPAGSSEIMADCIKKLLQDSELYQSLSNASFEAWKRIQIPVKWDNFIDRWLTDSPQNQKYLFEHRLASGIYKS